jgi:hypothetical protein
MAPLPPQDPASPVIPSPSAFERVKEEYLGSLVKRVEARASELASEDGRKDPNYVDSVRAFRGTIPAFGES